MSVPRALKRITHISEMFPSDVIPIFIQLFAQTFEQPQTMHIRINGVHVLFTTNLFLDLKEKVCGIVLHEVPFSLVEIYKAPKPKVHFFQNILIDSKGVIQGMERKNWDKMISRMELPTEWYSNNILRTNILSLLPSCAEIFFKDFYGKIQNVDSTVQFMIQTEYNNHSVIIFNSVSVFDESEEKRLLFTQEIAEEDEIEPVLPENAIIYNLNGLMEQCLICRRVRIWLPEYYKDFYSRHVVNYIHSIEPMLHPNNNLPLMGKRGSVGHQHESALSVIKEHGVPNYIKVWEKPKRFNITHRVVREFKPKLCKICHDEWQWLSLSLSRNVSMSSISTNGEKENISKK
jgi:hypothetical protein